MFAKYIRSTTNSRKYLTLFLALCSVIHSAEFLSQAEAEKYATKAWENHIGQLRNQRAEEMKNASITIGDKTMKFLSLTFGEAPAGGRPLVISMHGVQTDKRYENCERGRSRAK